MTANQMNTVVQTNEHSISERIESMQKLWRSGDARQLAVQFFTPDARLCGEGAPDATFGSDAVHAALKEILAATPHVEITLLQCTDLGPNVASTWLQWDAIDAKGAATPRIRSLTVWKKSEVWQICADMYSVGDFSAVGSAA